MLLPTPRSGSTDHLARWTELGAIVGEPPVAWTGPLSIDLSVIGGLLDLKYAALAAQASQTEAVRGILGEQAYREMIRVERFAAFLPNRPHVTRRALGSQPLLLVSNVTTTMRPRSIARRAERDEDCRTGKHVPDATGERTFAPDGTVDRTAGDGLLSELDEYAVEQALQIAEDGEDVEVVVMTLGPDDAADAIKRALQMGASAGIHIVDDAVHG
jgi:hypothetical protein